MGVRSRVFRYAPGVQLCLPLQEHFLFRLLKFCLSPGFLGTDLLLCPSVNWWESSLQLPGVWSCVSLCSLCSSLFLFLHPCSSPSSSPSLPFPSLLVSALPGGGGVGAAEVAGSKAVPALPESGQSESEPPEVEGGAKSAAGNEPLLGARDRPKLSVGPREQSWSWELEACLWAKDRDGPCATLLSRGAQASFRAAQ